MKAQRNLRNCGSCASNCALPTSVRLIQDGGNAAFSDHVPPFSPWSTTHFSVSPFIPDCSGNSTSRLQIASSGLSSLPPSDIQVWTDGSGFWSLFGAGGAGVYAPNATH